MEPGANITLLVALLAGLFSFVSPCVLPLVPTYMTYLAGSSLEELTVPGGGRAGRWRVVWNALAFVLGFSLVFVVFGLSASAAGQFLREHQTAIRKVSGLLVIFFGLNMLGLLRPSFLGRDHRLGSAPRGRGWWNSLALGALFSAGWTPCVGPVLASILLVAAAGSTAYSGGILLGAYSLGLALPFLAVAVFLDRFLSLAARFRSWLKWANVVTGLFLVLVGVMIYFNFFFRLSGLFRWGF